MRKNSVLKTIALVITVSLICVFAITFVACNDTKKFSNEIFISDFSYTYTISLKVNVRNHSTLPGAARTFEYKKGIDSLYDEIGWRIAYRKDDIIVVNVENNGRIYSCIIYPSGQKNEYVVHSMAYTLGSWADNQAIFFPSFWLDRDISPDDGADTVYGCAYKIEVLASYYRERGYYAQIEGNTLKVVCLLKYPSVFLGEAGEFGHRAISWSVVYDDENTIHFADVSADYPQNNL